MEPLKILLANMPFDGHFNPLVCVASSLKQAGHDVRWFTGSYYKEKVEQLSIPYYPFKKTVDYNQFNVDEVFPERLRYRNQIKRLNWDLQHIFIRRAPELFEDIQEINNVFPFDVLIADVMFTCMPLVKALLKKPALAIGVVPIIETSKDLPPAGLGMTPSYGFFGQLKQAFLRFLTDKVLLAGTHKMFREILNSKGIQTGNKNMFDILCQHATLLLQSGVPGFEFKRADLGKNVRFIGALIPSSKKSAPPEALFHKLKAFKKVILLTQGTIEKDPKKLIIPTINAFRNSDHLVIVTTGGSKTLELKEKYPDANIVIEDFIPFEQIMPHADVFVTNGGYGGVMLSVQHELPMIVAGIHEGKNEINARVGYFNLGINLQTENPTAEKIKESINKVLSSHDYKQNIKKLNLEFKNYDPNKLILEYILQVTNERNSLEVKSACAISSSNS